MLTFDARGHGQSGGLVSIDGPREIADVKEVEAWLAARPDVADTKIGAWGISYGGGAVLDSLVGGRAVGGRRDRRDVERPLLRARPAGTRSSRGSSPALAGSIPDAKKSPDLIQIQALAFSGRTRRP